jgi:hypothetical protein
MGGVMLLGEANREAPAQAELRPTCAGGTLGTQALRLGAYAHADTPTRVYW